MLCDYPRHLEIRYIRNRANWIVQTLLSGFHIPVVAGTVIEIRLAAFFIDAQAAVVVHVGHVWHVAHVGHVGHWGRLNKPPSPNSLAFDNEDSPIIMPKKKRKYRYGTISLNKISCHYNYIIRT